MAKLTALTVWNGDQLRYLPASTDCDDGRYPGASFGGGPPEIHPEPKLPGA